MPIHKAELLAKFDNCFSCLNWKYNIERLFTLLPDLSLKEKLDQALEVDEEIMRMHLIISLIKEGIGVADLDFCYSAVKKLEGLATHYFDSADAQGYREILRFYAGMGDYMNFIKLLPQCYISKKRYEMTARKILC